MRNENLDREKPFKLLHLWLNTVTLQTGFCDGFCITAWTLESERRALCARLRRKRSCRSFARSQDRPLEFSGEVDSRKVQPSFAALSDQDV